MNNPNLTREQLDEVWFFIAGYGFTRKHPPNDYELALLVEVARRDEAPWHVQKFLEYANQAEVA